MEELIKEKILTAVSPVIKMTERLIGFSSHNIPYTCCRYNGNIEIETKVSELERAIIYVINYWENPDLYNIGENVGFDKNEHIETEMLKTAVNRLQRNLELIKHSNHTYELTPKGEKFVKEGKCYEKSKERFTLFFDKDHLYFKHFHSLENLGKKINNSSVCPAIDLKTIKLLASVQATNVEHERTGVHLIDASPIECLSYNCEVYLCFVQNIKDDSIRTIVLDKKTKKLLPKLADLYDGDKKFREQFLKSCIDEEVKAGNLEPTEEEKSQEQKEQEEILISQEEASDATKSKGKEDISAGDILGTLQFEMQLKEIFEEHQNEEIWLISPWVKKYTFINKRLPAIKTFLKKGGTVFIGYSEPEKETDEMIDDESMKKIIELQVEYDKLIVFKTPVSHRKEVIEFKNKKARVFSGSFNVLSFSINEKDKNYRAESMTLSNEKQSLKTRAEDLSIAADYLIEEYKSKINSLKEFSSKRINACRLSYIAQFIDINERLKPLKELARQKNIELKSIEKDDDDYLAMAESVLSKNYSAKAEYLDALVPAIYFSLEYYRSDGEEKNWKEIQSVSEKLFRALGDESFYRRKKVILGKSKTDKNKTTVIIISSDDYQFNLGEFQLPNKTFNVANRKKTGYTNFKKSGIKDAKDEIRSLLEKTRLK